MLQYINSISYLSFVVISVSFGYRMWITAVSYLDYEAICEDIFTMDGLKPDDK